MTRPLFCSLQGIIDGRVGQIHQIRLGTALQTDHELETFIDPEQFGIIAAGTALAFDIVAFNIFCQGHFLRPFALENKIDGVFRQAGCDFLARQAAVMADAGALALRTVIQADVVIAIFGGDHMPANTSTITRCAPVWRSPLQMSASIHS